MSHINVLLQLKARDVLLGFAARSRNRFVFDPETLETGVEDTGSEYDTAIYPSIREFLREAAGDDHGISTIRDVLIQSLAALAKEHTTRPARVIATFLSDLDKRDLNRFLGDRQDKDIKQREAKVRHRLNKLGYRLEKSRKRDPLNDHYRVYDVLERATNIVNLDAPRNLDGLEQWLENMAHDQPDDLSPISTRCLQEDRVLAEDAA